MCIYEKVRKIYILLEAEDKTNLTRELSEELAATTWGEINCVRISSNNLSLVSSSFKLLQAGMNGETTIEHETGCSNISMLEMDFLEKCLLKNEYEQSSSKFKSKSMDIGQDLSRIIRHLVKREYFSLIEGCCKNMSYYYVTY